MIKSIQNAEHYSWGNNCHGWYLLQSKTVSVIQEKMPPGTVEQLHFHTFAQQLFYILSGIATFEIEGETISVPANESIHIPKGIIHSIANKGESDLNFLVISEPPSHGDRKNIP